MSEKLFHAFRNDFLQYAEVSQLLEDTCSSVASLKISEDAGIEPLDASQLKQQAARYVCFSYKNKHSLNAYKRM